MKDHTWYKRITTVSYSTLNQSKALKAILKNVNLFGNLISLSIQRCKHHLYSLKNSHLRLLIKGQNSLKSWETDLPDLTNFVKLFSKNNRLKTLFNRLNWPWLLGQPISAISKTTKCKTTNWNDKSTSCFSLLWKTLFFWKNLIDSVLN